MKKTLLLLLAAMFTLTGCGNKDKPDSPNDPGTEEHNGEIPNDAYEIYEKTILVEGTTDPYHKHTFQIVTKESVDSTCTSQGKSVFECTHCHCKYSVPIKCADHNFGDDNVCKDCECSIQYSTGLQYVKNNVNYYAARNGTRIYNDNAYLVAGIGNCNSDEIVIPSVHAGYKVIGVLDEAFKGNDFIKKITFTQNNFFIGKEAFNYCVNLTDVIFDCEIDTIDEYAFANCSKLKTMHLPASIARVHTNSFSNCPNLENKIVTKNGLTIFNTTILSGQDFTGSEIELGYEYTAVAMGAFSDKNSLTKLTVKNPFLFLGDSSFANCSNLRDVDLSQAMTNFIEKGNISTPSMSYYPIFAEQSEFESKRNKQSPFKNSTIANILCWQSHLPLFFSANRNEVKSLYITDKVMYFDPSSNYKHLNRLNLALFGNIETLHLCDSSYYDLETTIFGIGTEYTSFKSDNDPKYYDHLKNLILDMCVNKILFNDVSLDNVEINNTDYNKELNFSFFMNDKIKNLRVHSKIEKITGSINRVQIENIYFDFAKDEFASIPQDLNGSESVYEITKNLFFSDGQFGKEIVLEKEKEIAMKSFANNKDIVSLIVGGNVEKIGRMAFSGCTNLKTVKILGNVKEIGELAFENCPIENFEIYDSIEKIGNGAFNLEKVSTNITIENGCKYVGATNNPYLFCVGITEDVPEVIHFNSRCKAVCEESLNNKHVTTIYFDDYILSAPYNLKDFSANHLIWNSVAPMSCFFAVETLDISENITSVYFSKCTITNFNIPENSKLKEFKVSEGTYITNLRIPSVYMCEQIGENQYDIPGATHVYINNVEVSYGTLEIPEGMEKVKWSLYENFKFYRLILPTTYNDTKDYSNYFDNLRDVLNHSSIDNSLWDREAVYDLFHRLTRGEVHCSHNEDELGDCIKYNNEWYFYEYFGEYSTTKYFGGSNVITPDTPFKYSITNHLFNGVNIESVVLSSSVKKLESYAFDSYSKLTSLTIREGLEAIESNAIYCCNNLTELILPASLLDIAKNAVYFTLDKASIDTLYIRGSEESRTNLGSPITNLPNVVWDYVPEE